MSPALVTLLPKPSLTGEPLVDELRRLTRLSLIVANTADFDLKSAEGVEFLQHIAPDFECRIDNVSGVLSFRQLLDTWRCFATNASLLKYAEALINADVDEDSGEATTYMCADARYLLEATLAVRSFTAYKWRREPDGTWLIYECLGMRSTTAARY